MDSEKIVTYRCLECGHTLDFKGAPPFFEVQCDICDGEMIPVSSGLRKKDEEINSVAQSMYRDMGL